MAKRNADQTVERFFPASGEKLPDRNIMAARSPRQFEAMLNLSLINDVVTEI